MMHFKTVNYSNMIKSSLLLIIIIFALFLMKSNISAKYTEVIKVIENKTSLQEGVSRLIINSAVPILKISMNNEVDDDLHEGNVQSFLGYFTDVDLKNPQTYLASQIPLLSLSDANVLQGSVGGNLSSIESANEEKISVEITDRNLEPKLLENVKIDSSKPKVIIYHTHTTESYISTPANNYEMMGDHRTTDQNYNVCKVGEEIKKYIESHYGVAVHHDMTLHDYPSYEGSYNRSKPTIENLLKQFPDAQYIIDVHRDAFADSEAARKVMVMDVMGEQASKIMFVVGKSNPHWQENYYSALKLNQKIEELSPGLSKGILVKDRSIYNQDISNKAILIEVGSDSNTLEEALLSAKIFARALGEVLKDNP
ncbi:stage II sporulation protein P (SpoIIP) [Oxobacter pfennigii]|uniref:Stage II sporulation protein P (SpoIIP) n=1 Tax=Oxobacter pfennigii TaxID=36849 RepID=A0A0P8YAT2_9CLOT|nr:stage II sporulation protein P [Oxobacter pfennigii]KPU44130.1 stage II sporulation protein P (SpoIIP) [Oxobacter pfennigii]